MYGFSEEFLLDENTLGEVLSFYDDGMDFEIFKSELLISKIGEALGGRKTKRRKPRARSDRPDLKGFRRTYGNKIIRKRKKGNKGD